jgi:hypothetical protein
MLFILLQKVYHIKSRCTVASYSVRPMFKSMPKHLDGNRNYAMRDALIFALETKRNGVIEFFWRCGFWVTGNMTRQELVIIVYYGVKANRIT